MGMSPSRSTLPKNRLRFEWRIESVKGEEGRMLRLEQARAILNLILSQSDSLDGGDTVDEKEDG